MFNVFPWDGAYALGKVIEKRFGWAKTSTPGFFGPSDPQYINVEISHNEKVPVLWGTFHIPTTKAQITCGVHRDNGRLVFKVVCEMMKRDESLVRNILDDVREYLKTNSIYRGKAIKLRFREDNGNVKAIPDVSFIDTSRISREQLILPKDVRSAVETNLFTPIERVHDLATNGIPFKRGVLLGGTFGTGKTLASMVASKLAVDNGVTFIYVTRANELVEAIKLGEMYQSPASVVFCEDIDREMAGERRTAQMDDILNIIDGIDTKHANIMVVLTTNAMNALNRAMLRPGRLDAVIEVTPPDADTIIQLVRHYGKGLIDPQADLAQAGEALSGCIPAVVAEVVKRAKLSQLRLQPAGLPITALSAEAIIESAVTMKSQLALMKPPAVEVDEPIGSALSRLIAEQVGEAVGEVLDVANSTKNLAEEIRERV
jgi:transitional endoplasmic reticulum ATPase